MLPIVLRLVSWSVGVAYAHLYIAVFSVLQNFHIESKTQQNAFIMKVKVAVWQHKSNNAAYRLTKSNAI